VCTGGLPAGIRRIAVKKKPTSTKVTLPKFRSEEAAAGYLETHSVAEVWDQLPGEKQSKPSAALRKMIQKRHAKAKSPISIRLVPEQIEAAKRIAARRSVGYQMQLRMWIAEGFRREAKRS
jgi:predicted DNA binding CopG/RHH family protein